MVSGMFKVVYLEHVLRRRSGYDTANVQKTMFKPNPNWLEHATQSTCPGHPDGLIFTP